MKNAFKNIIYHLKNSFFIHYLIFGLLNKYVDLYLFLGVQCISCIMNLRKQMPSFNIIGLIVIYFERIFLKKSF
jgi:hypothetical protein